MIILLSFIVVWRIVLSVNIALHAQVNPVNKQIVGSVITTDGLKAALTRRFDVQNVSVFYPSAYIGFLDTEWDFIVIEGWFRSINDFIQLSRNRFRDVKIVYLCLDGHYPPFESLVHFDLDGILTNSDILFHQISPAMYKSYMLLAADSAVMQPNMTVSRDFGAVFVGAGGPMLALKPGLFELLVDAIPFKLRLHGFHWQDVPILGPVSLGPLPRYDIAQAYSSAHVVITSAIEAQDTLGMVNNRVFEALSCGAVVVSQHSSTLARLLTKRGTSSTDGSPLLDLVLFIDEDYSVQQVIESVKRNREYFDEVRRQGREFVLARHTWQHRAVQLMEFYRQIAPGYPPLSSSVGFCSPVSDRCARPNCPRLLWVASDHLLEHQDYLALTARDRDSMRGVMCRQYSIDEVSTREFHEMVHTAPKCIVTSVDNVCTFPLSLSDYDVLLAVATPFDAVDRTMVSFTDRSPVLEVRGKDRLQKRMMYMLGVDLTRVTEYVRTTNDELIRSGESETGALALVRKELAACLRRTYDVILYRSPFELSLLRTAGVELSQFRLQHVFGVGQHHIETNAVAAVFVCFDPFQYLCTVSERRNALSNRQKDSPDDFRSVVLLLLGGEWSDWLSAGVVRLEDIDRTVHVAQGRWSDESVSIIQRAQHVFVMHGPDHGGEPVGDLVGDCLDRDGTSPSWCGTETLSDSLWAVVAAAVSDRTGEGGIHLRTSNVHLMTSLGADGASEWSSSSLAQGVRFGLDRLHGFGPARSSLVVEQLVLRIVRDEVVCDNCPHDADEVLLRSNYLTTLHSVSSEGGDASVLLLRLEHSSFEVGRDGEVCLSNGNHGEEDRVCLMRSFRYVKLRVHHRAEAPRASSVEMRFTLRGTFYADTFLEQRHTFALPSWQASLLNDTLIDTGVLDSVFVYDVHL